jgi:hypothetical protein
MARCGCCVCGRTPCTLRRCSSPPGGGGGGVLTIAEQCVPLGAHMASCITCQALFSDGNLEGSSAHATAVAAKRLAHLLAGWLAGCVFSLLLKMCCSMLSGKHMHVLALPRCAVGGMQLLGFRRCFVCHVLGRQASLTCPVCRCMHGICSWHIPSLSRLACMAMLSTFLG